MNSNALTQRAFIFQSLKATVETSFPTCLRPESSKGDIAIKRSLALSVGKFTLTTELLEDGWNEITEHASELESPAYRDFVWNASEQNNRHFRVFNNGNSMETLFDCKGMLTGKSLGWETQHYGVFRYAIIGSIATLFN